MYRPLDAFLLRAPLLPESALRRGAKALTEHPLGAQAIAVASPSLAAAKPGAKRDRALARYARRAAFRPTPNGLLAGVCMGGLGPRTRVLTGAPDLYRAPSWAGVNAAARALLDDPDVRERTRLRIAPSAIRSAAGAVRWIGPGEPFGETREGELDARLAAILDSANRWTLWADVRSRIDDDDDGDADELLLMLVDDGLLQSDLAPPLIGPPADVYLTRKLAAIGAPPSPLVIDRDQAVLIHRARRSPTLERAAVDRAARLVPLLIALNDALAPPASERFAQPALSDALDAATETFGAGAFDLASLVAGDYGVDAAGDEQAAPQPPSARVTAVVVDAIMEALAHGRPAAELDPAAFVDLAAPPLPATAELFLAPVPRQPRSPPGTGWLLGVHAPAGASFGRFAHALGAPMTDALSALDAAERRARPSAEVIDVAFAPSPELADLVARPPVRRRTLAVSSWSDDDDVTLHDLELVADPSQPEALALRTHRERTPVVPSPLARLRSATAPAGVVRLLTGWSLLRQHATWALALGPLASLAFVPRITIDGFVVSPASWRLPTAKGRAALRRWRRERRVPRYVQVGDGDELLPVDLDAPDAAADLAGRERAIEIWPPLGATVDRGGRRTEAIVMLVAEATPAETRADDELRGVEQVPPPRLAPSFAGWRSFRIYGAPEHQDELLSAFIAPAVFAARDQGTIDVWFFLPYVDGPGRRPHLRLRVHAVRDGDGLGFERALRAALAPARARGQVTTVDGGDYHPEHGRFTPQELSAALSMFESDSELRVHSAGADGVEPVQRFVRAADALARGLGLDLAGREALARDRRRAAERSMNVDDEARRETDAAFRIAGRELRRALADDPAGEFLEHHDRVSRAARLLPAPTVTRLAPTLLHQSAVRFLGPDADAERVGYTFWERTLHGLGKR